ncbi:hypothetical protein FHX42_003493 [Saccharopolyspora lacisalsi]|uniref:Uncharacterized protein n=1 Tax=Halosaccharopolyspora lacisalsi TaxID=1000566 RepID=A0A839E2Z5_9PSEU|nr:hypothetical protein [Halosaccharopolyspora lacisalsi]MBA8826117.1 hypothetical protein [Halosaccharopolyspora lacisalsi]
MTGEISAVVPSFLSDGHTDDAQQLDLFGDAAQILHERENVALESHVPLEGARPGSVIPRGSTATPKLRQVSAPARLENWQGTSSGPGSIAMPETRPDSIVTTNE